MSLAGIDLGPAVTGVVGARKPQFDIWGSCVNTAREIERTGLVNTVNVSIMAIILFVVYCVAAVLFILFAVCSRAWSSVVRLA